MRLTASTRQRLATAMVGVLLFAQCLTAAYACPGLAQALAGGAPAAQAAPEGCHGGATDDLGSASPALCKAHCEVGQSAPASAAPDVAAAPLAAMFIVCAFGPLVADGAAAERFAAPWPAAPPGWPPLYLTHGVLRN
jgi:hypothetical protein